MTDSPMQDHDTLDPTHSSSRPKQARKALRLFRVGIRFVAVLIVTLLCAYFGAHMYRSLRHTRVSDRMQMAIARLALTCPSGLAEHQWSYCIYWTWNLHCNYGIISSYVPTEDLQRIVAEFEKKIDAGASLATIDWLWDEYYRSFSGARDYERYRPTSLDKLSELDAEFLGPYTLDWWRSKYDQKMSRGK